MGSVTWTEQETEILRQIYPTQGMKGVRHLLSRHSEGAIYRHAYRLRISYALNWSNDELKKLSELFPVYGKACAKEFPNRSWSALLKQASRLGLRSA